MHPIVPVLIFGLLFIVAGIVTFVFRGPMSRRSSSKQRARFGAWSARGSTPASYGLVSGVIICFGIFITMNAFFHR
jgi:hypothetical protein